MLASWQARLPRQPGRQPLIAFAPEHWTGLFTAAASAALTGLVFVALSINLAAILDSPGLPERALAAVTMLLGVGSFRSPAWCRDSQQQRLGRRPWG